MKDSHEFMEVRQENPVQCTERTERASLHSCLLMVVSLSLWYLSWYQF